MSYQRPTLEISAAKRERTYIGLSFGIVIGLILFIALCWGGRRSYLRWQERRLVARAETALKNGNDREAGLAAQTVLQMKPSSIGATRIAAQLSEKSGSRAAIEFRRKIVQQLPNSFDDILSWAKTALRFNDTTEAQRALDRLSPNDRNNAAYHAVAALLEQQLHHEDQAVREWTEAVRLAPEDKASLFELGVAEIKSSNSATHTHGKTTLLRLRSDRQFRLGASRALAQDGIAHHANATELLTLAQEIQEYPEADISDRILYLDFLHQLQDPKFASYLTTLEQSVANHPADLSFLLNWLSRSNLNLLAQDFSKTLTPQQLQAWPVPASLADIDVRLKNWRQLENSLKKTNWRELDFLRHAYLARALRGLEEPAASAHEWASAAAGATQGAETTFQLCKLADEWGWEAEAVDLLWSLSKYPDRQKDALTSLYKHFVQQEDADGIFRVLARLSDLEPDNLDIRNNLAQIGLLLETKPAEARRLAADDYQKQPSNAIYATTYAYSLLSEGSKDKALAVMKKLTPEQLKDPAVAAYYGLCLAAVKDPEATTYLKEAEKARLLPQERALVKKAWDSLR